MLQADVLQVDMPPDDILQVDIPQDVTLLADMLQTDTPSRHATR